MMKSIKFNLVYYKWEYSLEWWGGLFKVIYLVLEVILGVSFFKFLFDICYWNLFIGVKVN